MGKLILPWVNKFFFIFLIFFSLFANFSYSQKASSRPLCTSISAEKVGVNKIRLTWKNPPDFKAASIAIFRSTSQIQLSSTISAEKPVAEVPSHATSYTDNLKHFGEYYYALIARDKNGSLFNILLPSVNSTVKSVTLLPPSDYYEPEIETEEQYTPGFLRDLPLPYLDLISDLNIPPTKFKASTVNAGRQLAGKYAVQKAKVLSPYVFPEDMINSPQGDDFYLFESLKKYFIQKDYKNSVTDLKNFLGISRSPSVRNRAVFYLAQSQYYCRHYRQALSLFLYTEDEYPELSKKWIDSILDLYQIPKE